MQNSSAEQQCRTPKINRPIDDLNLSSRAKSEDYFLDQSLSLSEKLEHAQYFKPTFKGMLELIIGPMFAGKSTELLRRVRRHSISGKECLYVKYAADTRYDTANIATHDLLTENARAVTLLSELGDDWKNFDVIGVDEGQFYNDVVEFCEMAAHAGKIVIVSALGATYQREGFNSILELVPKAEKIKQLHAICKLCFEPASFTLRTCQDQNMELIGGAEAYMPVCRECFFVKTQEQEQQRQHLQDKTSAVEVTYGAQNGSPEDEAKLIVSTQRSSTTDCETAQTNSSGAAARVNSGMKEHLMGSPMVAAAPFTEDNESPENLKH